jgi:hypothetical protein
LKDHDDTSKSFLGFSLKVELHYISAIHAAETRFL